LMIPVGEAIEFPFGNPRWPYRLGIGGAISALPVFSFTVLGSGIDLLSSSLISAPLGLLYLLVWGYAFGVFRAAFHGEPADLKGWENWREFLSQGFVVFIIGLGYGLLPFLMMAMGIGILYRGGWWLFAGILLLMLGMLAFVLVAFFFPMGIAQYIRWRRLEAAFHIPALWRAIRPVLVEYVSAFLLFLVTLLALGLVAAIPLAGPTLAFFLGFYPTLVLARLFGGVCASSGAEA
ncbi:MAG: DUF4013 domain-containing protein, partial [candidate division NC10 bacterium]|nr:DUF4013 domain-containing protein [candidate division NC10 bacterium]